jgi:hypothetical protein
MTKANRDEIKRNATSIMTFANLILLLTFVWYQSAFQERAETHMESEEKHLELKELNKLFIPRTEMNVKYESIQDLFLRIDKKLDKLDAKIDEK